MLKNKGQVSMFIVIGIIIVIVSIFLFVNSKMNIFVSFESQMKNDISEAVKTCIEKEAVSGTFMLGFQGGYISVPNEIRLNPKKHTEISGLKVPNWDSERGDIPTIGSMESELETHIQDNSIACIKNRLRDLEEVYELDYSSELKIDAQINQESIGINIEYPVVYSEKNSEKKSTLEAYYVKLDPLRIGDLYELAVEIYNLEESSNFLEELTLDQIHSASDYSSRDSMPSEGMNIKCGQIPWTIPQLKKNLIQLNNNNFKYLYIDGTYSKEPIFDANLNEELGTLNLRDYFKSPATGYIQYMQNPQRSFTNYNAEFMLPVPKDLNRAAYGPKDPFRTFEVSPSDGNIVKPIEMEVDMGVKIPIPCIQVYHHLYTLDYDILVTLTDMNEDGSHYTFQFPLRVNIEGNNPKSKAPNLIVSEQGTVTNDNYCSAENKMYPKKILVTDTSGNYLEDVNISYKCISLSCDMGITEKPRYDFNPNLVRENALPRYEGNFPFCLGGVVIANKEGYHTAKVRTDTTVDAQQIESASGCPECVDIELIKTKEFQVTDTTFFAKTIEGGGSRWISEEEDGYVYMSVENKEQDFESNIIVPVTEGFYDKLVLLDGDYSYAVSIIYTDKDYNLKGMVDIESWRPDVSRGTKLEVVIPTSSSIIDENNFMSYYEKSQELMSNPRAMYGINLI